MPSKVTGIRLKPVTVERLDMLAELSGMSRAEYMNMLINAEYDRITGNPKLKALLEQMQVLKRQLDELNGDGVAAGNASMVSDKA